MCKEDRKRATCTHQAATRSDQNHINPIEYDFFLYLVLLAFACRFFLRKEGNTLRCLHENFSARVDKKNRTELRLYQLLHIVTVVVEALTVLCMTQQQLQM